MTACSFKILTVYLSFIFIFHRSHGFKVIQPRNQTVNPDGSVFISCEHDAKDSSVQDVRLNRKPVKDRPKMLCQKGMEKCEDIIMHEENQYKWLFIMLNVGQEAMNTEYECEFTVKKGNLDYTEKGTPTVLLPGQKETICVPTPPPPPPPPPQSGLLLIILIGLLALMFLCTCIITSFYIRLRCTDKAPENSTYVEMRKAPLPRNQP
ncbi:uncharacterized protein LOC119904541 [Micropterus salmoides]|uniref:uncharacterized protein LOC119904541 n=1 Tax=Micropterus salmoides TaxID=27706 RepID=UPI0018EA6F1E|nr:uncharacterized protein LOC119904541 [Micropterus salmoides]